MTARMGTPDGDRLNVLATLIEAYEAKQFLAEPIDPIDVIKFALDQKRLTLRDLGFECPVDKVRNHDGLAGAGGRHCQHTSVGTASRLVRIDQLLLVVAQLDFCCFHGEKSKG